jgi:hypothetical protein
MSTQTLTEKKDRTYQGHRSWNAWNVSLWINNDYGIYKFALDCVERAAKARDGQLSAAAQLNLATRLFMQDFEGQKTPDGAKYNATCVKECLKFINS